MGIRCFFGWHKWRNIGHLYNTSDPPTIAIYDKCEICGATARVRFADIDDVATKRADVLRYLKRHGPKFRNDGIQGLERSDSPAGMES